MEFNNYAVCVYKNGKKINTSGVLGDEDDIIYVLCNEDKLPKVFERDGNGNEFTVNLHDIPQLKSERFSENNWKALFFSYKGYDFSFVNSDVYIDDISPHIASVISPDGTYWKCEYGRKNEYDFG